MSKTISFEKLQENIQNIYTVLNLANKASLSRDDADTAELIFKSGYSDAVRPFLISRGYDALQCRAFKSSLYVGFLKESNPECFEGHDLTSEMDLFNLAHKLAFAGAVNLGFDSYESASGATPTLLGPAVTTDDSAKIPCETARSEVTLAGDAMELEAGEA